MSRIFKVFSVNKGISLGGFKQLPTKRPLWKMAPSKVEDSSTGPAFYLNENGEVVEIQMETAIFLDGKLWNVGSWSQICPHPLDPSNWSLSNTTRAATGNSIGVFNEYVITDTGASSNGGIRIVSSIVPGSTKQYYAMCYNIGTSGSAAIVAYDITSGLSSRSKKISGVWTSETTSAGVITIHDDIEHEAGFRIVLFTISWLNPSHSVLVSFCPNSTTLKNIYVYGCLYVTSLGHTYPFTNPNGSTTIVSRAGTTTVPITSKLEDLLDGSKDCKFIIKLVPMFVPSDFPVSHTESIFNTGIIDMLTLSTDASGNGYVNLSDGTNTATVAYDWESGEELIIEAPIGYNVVEAADKMQLKVNGEVSALTAFDGSFGPDTEISIGQNNDYLFGVSMIINQLKQSDWS